MLKIVNLEWNDDFVGYFVELEDGREVGCQFEIETNELHADYNTRYAVPVSLEDATQSPENFTDEELFELKEVFNKNKTISAMAETLTEKDEEERNERYDPNNPYDQ